MFPFTFHGFGAAISGQGISNVSDLWICFSDRWFALPLIGQDESVVQRNLIHSQWASYESGIKNQLVENDKKSLCFDYH